ncbi:MAG: hypothetical protein DRQ88_11650 [Epsilonproteobacteria bacterium]|nr:MAG: hypothetical protein DRQ89_08075 [Campylobacterota bacterium]RLA64040.1 MAG: hypothetical protein DRQ88_11650 [Campylobacterota bacterium]
MIFFFLLIFCYLAIFDFKKLSDVGRGEKLFFKIFEIEEELYSGQIPGVYHLYEYKFFSPLLAKLLEYARVFGLPPESFIPRLRGHLSRDLRFEREVKKLYFEGVAQFIVIFIISWFFKYFASTITSSSSSQYSLEALGLQIMGPICFFAAYTHLKKKIFGPFAPYFAAYYNLWALMKMGSSTGEVLAESKVLQLKPVKEPFKSLHHKMIRPLKAWEQKGIPILPLIELVIEELWEIYDQEFQKFHKILKVLSFLILALFYLGAYFMLVWGTLGPFLIEMKGPT